MGFGANQGSMHTPKKIVKLYYNLVKLKGKDIDTNLTYGNNYIDITYLNVPDFFEMTK